MEIINIEDIFTQLTTLITTLGSKVVRAIVIMIVGRIAAVGVIKAYAGFSIGRK